jgi:hypothetical protein
VVDQAVVVYVLQVLVPSSKKGKNVPKLFSCNNPEHLKGLRDEISSAEEQKRQLQTKLDALLTQKADFSRQIDNIMEQRQALKDANDVLTKENLQLRQQIEAAQHQQQQHWTATSHTSTQADHPNAMEDVRTLKQLVEHSWLCWKQEGFTAHGLDHHHHHHHNHNQQQQQQHQSSWQPQTDPEHMLLSVLHPFQEEQQLQGGLLPQVCQTTSSGCSGPSESPSSLLPTWSPPQLPVPSLDDSGTPEHQGIQVAAAAAATAAIAAAGGDGLFFLPDLPQAAAAAAAVPAACLLLELAQGPGCSDSVPTDCEVQSVLVEAAEQLLYCPSNSPHFMGTTTHALEQSDDVMGCAGSDLEFGSSLMDPSLLHPQQDWWEGVMG